MRAGELAFRSGVRPPTPATAGGSLRNLPARLADKRWLHVVVDVCHGQSDSMKKPLLFVSHKPVPIQRSLRSRGPELHGHSPFPPQASRCYIAGTKEDHVTRCQPTAAPATGCACRSSQLSD